MQKSVYYNGAVNETGIDYDGVDVDDEGNGKTENRPIYLVTFNYLFLNHVHVS